jgi:cysteine-rich repeat protein
MNDENTDDCVAGCKLAKCGDGFFHSGVEQCEDGNTNNGDGCSSTCVTEPPVCGNGRIEAGETCDDGNTVDGDACPSNCRVESCTPTAVRQDTTVVFTKPAGVNVGSMVVFVNYPDGKVSLPGVGNGSTVRARITSLPTGFVHTANDLDYAIREVLSPQLPGNILNGSTLLKASYDLCSGQTAPTAAAYTCTVEQVGSPTGTAISPAGFTCSVTIP